MNLEGLQVGNVARMSIARTDVTRQLVLREARRAALSPILLVACALAGWAMWGGWIDGDPPPLKWATDLYDSLFYNAWPLLFGAFLLGASTLSRERRGTTEELFTAMPLSAWHRTAARLMVAVVPALAAVLVVGVQAVLVAAAGGVPLGDEYAPLHVMQLHVMPTPVEWASIPVATIASYTAGAAVYVLTHSRAITAFVGAFLTLVTVVGYWVVSWPPIVFISPIGTPVPDHVLPTSQLTGVQDGPLALPNADDASLRLLDPDPVLSGAHSVALLGMAVLFAALTLQSTAPDPRNHRLAWTGAAVVGAASIAQVVAYVH